MCDGICGDSVSLRKILDQLVSGIGKIRHESRFVENQKAKEPACTTAAEHISAQQRHSHTAIDNVLAVNRPIQPVPTNHTKCFFAVSCTPVECRS